MLKALFVNADLIAYAKWPDSPEEHAYHAQQEAFDIRDKLLDALR